MPGDDWRTDALCAQTDPEAFFPAKGGSTRDAKRICQRCPERAECLEFALEHDERFGVWGGLSERERRRLRKPTHPDGRRRDAAELQLVANLTASGWTTAAIANQLGKTTRTVLRMRAAAQAGHIEARR